MPTDMDRQRAWLQSLSSYQNVTFGGSPPRMDLHLATRLRLIGKCPGCGRHEEGKWWRPCPFAECPSHAAAIRPAEVEVKIEEV